MPAERRQQVERRETPEETFERFVGFTKHPFDRLTSGRFEKLADEWEYSMLMLYGSEEVMRLNKDEKLRGVKGITDKLKQALAQDGLNGLKVEFVKQTLEHTSAGRVNREGHPPESTLPAIKRILEFT